MRAVPRRGRKRYGKLQKLETVEFDQFESVTGQGLRSRGNGGDCFLGRREWIAAVQPDARIAQIPATAGAGVGE